MGLAFLDLEFRVAVNVVLGFVVDVGNIDLQSRK